ncbi:hypothetical protein C8Q74DRAFT_1270627 [Fomes fomentarius]|nr:hypothetical protein C8Q74DRAFT_1270627 [Fomes fomentarius]
MVMSAQTALTCARYVLRVRVLGVCTCFSWTTDSVFWYHDLLHLRVSSTTMTDQYVNPKYARASYRPKNLMSPGLQRAREPFRLRNALTGLVLTGFAVGVWAYSIGAVKQDAFDDVDEEARALMAGSGNGIQKAEDGAAAEGRGAVEVARTSGTVPPSPGSTVVPTTTTVQGVGESRRRGVLPPLLEHRIPQLFDPLTGTLVWGAPSVDNVGKLRDASAGSRRVA